MNDEPYGPYTRRKVKVQLGDGPDQRGEVTVETVHDRDPDSEETEGSGFADWKLEVDRCTHTLRDKLGLPEEDES